MTSNAMTAGDAGHDLGQHTGPAPSRRDFLYIATGAMAAVGIGAVAWPLIDQMQPDAAAIAAGAPIDVDISALEPGQQMTVKWRGAPIFLVRRSADSLRTLQNPKHLAELRDPASDVRQQPPYADNWHRSAVPDLAVYVGICTHLGCVPKFFPNPSDSEPVAAWEGGFFCPCHGSKYDLAGRVFQGVPAPYNLPVPPYRKVSDKIVRVGENPEGVDFDLSSVVQM